MAAGAAAAATLPGCAGRRSEPGYARPLSRGPFAPPRISADRVVRVIVGLRPYRPSGFVVRSERFDDKRIIHNYGHGGGGIMGLTTARLLQDAGWQITIYTRDMARHSTSNVGGGQWAPTSVFEEGVATPEFEEKFKFAARAAHHAYQNLIGAGYGVRFIENYYLGDAPLEMPYYLRELPELFTSVADLAPHQHPFPVRYVRRDVTMLIEPATFLRRVRNDFLRAGGRFVIRDFQSCSEVLAVTEPVIAGMR